jgi:hypothetical protein
VKILYILHDVAADLHFCCFISFIYNQINKPRKPTCSQSKDFISYDISQTEMVTLISTYSFQVDFTYPDVFGFHYCFWYAYYEILKIEIIMLFWKKHCYRKQITAFPTIC